jgi:RNA polymerase sigma-70 factor (ECF subfamily)
VAKDSNPAEDAYRAHRAQIYKFLLRKTGDPAEAEELTQRVFADAAAVLSRADTTPSSLIGWLYAVADRRFVDELRRRSRDERLVANMPARVGGSDYGPAVAHAIKRAVAELPHDHRRLVVMKVLEGRPFAEIATLVGISEAACKMRFSRAIKRVRKSLEDEGFEP